MVKGSQNDPEAQPFLPTYSDEKAPIDTEPEAPRGDGAFDESGTPLRVGGRRPSPFQKVKAWSSIRKFIATILLGWMAFFGIKATTLSFRGRHHRHHGFGGEPANPFDTEELDIIKATYLPPTIVESTNNDNEETYYTSSASFPVDTDKWITIQVDGTPGKVVVSRSDVTGDETTAKGVVVIESTWTGEEDEVTMASGEVSNRLSIKAKSTSEHVLYLTVPSSVTTLPYLHLSGSTIDLTLDASASDLKFDHLSISADGDIALPDVLAHELQVNTLTGDVKGTFNVSRELVLHSFTGNISADINVLPPPRPPHHHGDHKHHKHHGEHDHPHSRHGKHGRKHCKGGEEKRRPHGDHNDEEESDRPSWWPFKNHKGEDRPEPPHRGPPGHGDRRPPHGPPPHGGPGGPGGPGGHGGPHGPHGPPPPHGPPGPHGPGRHHGPPGPPPHRGPHGPHGPHGPGGRHGPPPAHISAFSSTGSISIKVLSQPQNVSSIIKAFSHTGSVDVKQVKTFKGFFEAGTHVGSVTIDVRVDGKEMKIIKEIVGEKGRLVEGFVKPEHKGNATEFAGDDEEEFDQFDEPRGPPPHKGPGGPGGPRDGPGGPHHGPGGPGGPGGPHRGPGGPGGPHRGPGGPGGPHHGPGGPGGPHGHHGPPPPGFGAVIAHTDVGNVTLKL